MGAASKTTWLRASYRIGATVDFLAALIMLLPAIGSPGPDSGHVLGTRGAVYAMAIAGSLMLGWGFLLIWADRKPVERKGVLIITAIPAVVGLLIPGSFAVAADLIPVHSMATTWVLQILITALFLFSYYNARSLEQT